MLEFWTGPFQGGDTLVAFFGVRWHQPSTQADRKSPSVQALRLGTAASASTRISRLLEWKAGVRLRCLRECTDYAQAGQAWPLIGKRGSSDCCTTVHSLSHAARMGVDRLSQHRSRKAQPVSLG